MTGNRRLLTTAPDLPTRNTSATMVSRVAILEGAVAVMLRSRSHFTACQSNLALLVVRSRQLPVAGIARTGRARLDPGIAPYPSSQASLGIDHRGSPPRPAITSPLGAATRHPIVFCPRHRLHAFRSLCSTAAQGRGPEPRAFHQIQTRPPGRWGNARRATRQPRSQNQ